MPMCWFFSGTYTNVGDMSHANDGEARCQTGRDANGKVFERAVINFPQRPNHRMKRAVVENVAEDLGHVFAWVLSAVLNGNTDANVLRR